MAITHNHSLFRGLFLGFPLGGPRWDRGPTSLPIPLSNNQAWKKDIPWHPFKPHVLVFQLKMDGWPDIVYYITLPSHHDPARQDSPLHPGDRINVLTVQMWSVARTDKKYVLVEVISCLDVYYIYTCIYCVNISDCPHVGSRANILMHW